MNQSFMGLNTRSLLMAGLIAGAGIGLLSNIPLLACVNCLLLGWVWGGGILSVYLYRRYEQGQPYLTTSQGLTVGAVAGVVGAVVGGIVAALFSGLTSAMNTALANMAGDTSSYIPDFLLTTGFSLLGIVGNLFLYALVGAIGGLIATTLIWKQPVLPPPASGPTV